MDFRRFLQTELVSNDSKKAQLADGRINLTESATLPTDMAGVASSSAAMRKRPRNKKAAAICCGLET
jgi:hypothetical protein